VALKQRIVAFAAPVLGLGILVGLNAGSVSNSYTSGAVSGEYSVGGLVGTNIGTVSNCYSTANVTGGTFGVGGLVGSNGVIKYSGRVTNCFWDVETSGQATSAAGTGKTTAEMKDIDTFTDAGWNIIAVANAATRDTSYTWNIVDGVTYPFLSWQD
jgi:hypothetical protein